MFKLVGPAITIALSLWALGYTGPVVAENPDFLASAFLWLLVVTSALSFVIKLIQLPFSRRK